MGWLREWLSVVLCHSRRGSKRLVDEEFLRERNNESEKPTPSNFKYEFDS